MDIEDIKPLLPLETGEVDALWADWLEEGGLGGPDLDPFVTSLRDRGLIDETTWRSLLVGGELHLMSAGVMNADDPPDTLGERFLLLGLLGKGAMGEVHLAQQRELKRKVAVKRLRARHLGSDRMLDRFLREVQITAQLDHPNIVPIYTVEYDEDDAPAAAMKLVQGRTLREFLAETLRQQRQNAVDAEHALPRRLELFLKLCDAMAYAHERGIVHRDLKPDNIMIGRWGEVYVMDWGIARSVREPDQDLHIGAVLTAHGVGETGTFGGGIGAVIGTPRYMSPEQAQGDPSLDARSDQYSLGLLLFELIALGPGNAAQNAEDAITAALDAELAPLEHAVPGVRIPPELGAVVLRATAPDPAERYPSVRDLGDDVRRYLDGVEVLARPDTPMQATLRWISRNRASALALILALVATALLAVTWSLVHQRSIRAEAALRQENLSAALSLVSERAGQIDVDLLRLQGLLMELAGAAGQAIASPPGDGALTPFDDAYDDPARAPTDYRPSPRYGKAISTDHAVLHLAPGVREEDVDLQVRQLSGLAAVLPQVVLASQPGAATTTPDRRALIADRGVPIVWAFFGTEEGVHLAYPGKGGYGPDYDPRRRPWYRLSAEGPAGPRWGAPYLDAQGQGLLLPFTTAVRDRRGHLAGVAGMELTLRFVVASWLALPELPGVRETLLLTERGDVAVRSRGEAGTATSGPDGALLLRPFDDPEVLEEVRAGRSSSTTRNGELIVWRRLPGLGWYYVARADAAAVLGGAPAGGPGP